MAMNRDCLFLPPVNEWEDSKAVFTKQTANIVMETWKGSSSKKYGAVFLDFLFHTEEESCVYCLWERDVHG